MKSADMTRYPVSKVAASQRARLIKIGLRVVLNNQAYAAALVRAAPSRDGGEPSDYIEEERARLWRVICGE
jgi:hypothetical protein